MIIPSELLRGNTETIILALLEQRDSYGYEINKSISALSDGQYLLKEATLYSAFRRMEDAGSIRSYWGDEEHGARRRYYTLTDEGRILLKQQREDWEKAKYLLDRLILGENEKKTGGESHEQSV